MSLDGDENGNGNSNDTAIDRTLLIILAPILSIILLLLVVMIIKMRKKINTLKQVLPNTNGNNDGETWEDNAVTERKAMTGNEEEKVDEGNTENAGDKADVVYDLGKDDYLHKYKKAEV